jgi:hypothetical protein
MQKLAGRLSGRKTYITAITAIVLSWLAFLVGEPVAGTAVLDGGELITLTVTSLLAVFLRNGIANTTPTEEN